MTLLFALCLAHANPIDPATAFEEWTGAALIFEEENLPDTMSYQLSAPLAEEDRNHAASIALEQARHFPRGSLADAGLTAVGIFAALGSTENDGYHQWDDALGGYAYFGESNGRGMIVAAHYTDRQLPLTLHHEWFHLIDTKTPATEPYRAPELSHADRRALEALRVYDEPVLRGAVSEYASKNPAEDRAETARHLHAHLPDALLQVVERPKLAGSQRFLHVLAVQEEVLGAGFDWAVDVALGRSLPQTHERIRPDGEWAIYGGEDRDGINWTLRGDLTDLGAEASGMEPGQIVSHVALIAAYHAWIASKWDITPGTRVAFRGALDDSLDALPISHEVLANSLRNLTLEDLAAHLDLDTPVSDPVTHTVLKKLSAHADVNPSLSKVDAALSEKMTTVVRRAQPAMVRVLVGNGAGSGVNLSAGGRILTAGHVTPEIGRRARVLFPDGTAIFATCIALDSKLDLALLAVDEAADLPFASLAKEAPVVGEVVAIVGQPGDSNTRGRPTGYEGFHVSSGHIRGFAADRLGNQRRGGTAHDAWTYWGHSGSALLDANGDIVAMHNSWDPANGMRHAVTWEALDEFLDKYL